MKNNLITEMKNGFETAYINSSAASNLAYRPEFISNNYKRGKKVLSSIEDELLKCDQFQISVAFITLGGITPLLQTLRELEDRGIKGEILTTNYLTFTEPKALKKLNDFLKSVYLIATRDLSNLWLQFFLSQNQGFMRLFEKTVLK